MNTDDILLAFEKNKIRGEYLRYFTSKRKNYFKSIQDFGVLWDGFLALDEIWEREFADMRRVTISSDILPINMFKGGHALYRVAFELGFSPCVIEAANIARPAIEAAVQAHKIHREPHLAAVWSSKHHGPAQKKAFKKAFEDNKKDSLFPVKHELRELHNHFVNYSELGSHCSIDGFSLRHSRIVTSNSEQWNVRYLESDPVRLGPFLASMLHAFGLVEKAFFDCFSSRLNLDNTLVDMRRQFEKIRREGAAEIIQRFNLNASPIQLFRQ